MNCSSGVSGGRGWYERTVTVAAVLLFVVAVSGAALLDVSFGRAPAAGERRFSIVVELFGSDAERVERTITVPLEETLAGVAGITSLRSVSRYGYSRTDITASPRYKPEAIYLSLRDAVDRAYSGFPRSAQKPKLFRTGTSSRPVFMAAFSGSTLSRLRDAVETDVKPLFEKIEGTGEIEIGGGAVSEVHVSASSEKIAHYGFTPREIAAALDSGNREGPLGTIAEYGREVPVSLGRGFTTIRDIARTRMPSGAGTGSLQLSDIAEISTGYRKQDSVSRVDGKRRIVLAVKSDGSSNLITLSKKLNRLTEKLRRDGFRCTVVLDAGEEARQSVLRVLRAMAVSLCSVFLFLLLFAGGARRIIVLALSLPVILLFSAALLTRAGISLGPWILSGFAVGTGLIIDSGIIISESRNGSAGAGALLSSAATTIAAVAPLFFLKNSLPQVRGIALSLTVLIASGTVLPLLFMPAFLRPAAARTQKIPRNILRLFYLTVFFAMRHKKMMNAGAAAAVGAALTAALITGTDFSAGGAGETLYVHLEGKSGETVSSVDRTIRRITASIETVPGVVRIGTTAKRGSGEMTVEIDPAVTSRDAVAGKTVEAGAAVPDCYLSIPERDTADTRAFEMSITGSDVNVLKAAARSTAELLSRKEAVEKVVLHFKDDMPAYRCVIDHNRVLAGGWTAAGIGDYLHRSLYGPPAVKWQYRGKEIDIRIMGEKDRVTSREDLAAFPLPAGEGRTVRLDTAASIEAGTTPSAVYRKNRQRAVSFTVHTRRGNREGGLDSAVAAIRKTVEEVRLPRGYGFEMDKRVFELKQQFRALGLLFVLSAVLIFMILAAQFESLLLPLPVMAAVPVSLSVPLLIRGASGAPLTVETLIGIIILAGIIVNNAILITTALHRGGRSVVTALRGRLRPLLLTSGTTVLSSLPLLISSAAAGNSGEMAGSLASMMVWGIMGSVATTFLFLPAVPAMFPGSDRRGNRDVR